MRITKLPQNFEKLIQFLGESQNYIRAIDKANQLYDLKSFKVKTLAPAQVVSTFQNLQHKLCQIKSVDLDTPWLQNERRIFLWLVFGYCFRQGIQIEQFNNDDWNYFSEIFPRRQTILFKYQLNLIQRQSDKRQRRQKWTDFENQVLQKSVENYEKGFRWNDVAKRFFMLTHEKYFRTPKQCRQQWINHLDPLKLHCRWTLQEDEILFEQIQQKGKKWAAISKAFGQRRTQHMIKNRYNALMKILLKKHNGSSEHKIVANPKKYLEDIHAETTVIRDAGREYCQEVKEQVELEQKMQNGFIKQNQQNVMINTESARYMEKQHKLQYYDYPEKQEERCELMKDFEPIDHFLKLNQR